MQIVEGGELYFDVDRIMTDVEFLTIRRMPSMVTDVTMGDAPDESWSMLADGWM